MAELKIFRIRAWFKHPKYETGEWRTLIVVAESSSQAQESVRSQWERKPTSHYTCEEYGITNGLIVNCSPRESHQKSII